MQSKTTKIVRLLAATALLGAILACGSSGDTTESTTPGEPETPGAIRIQQVVFARQLDDQWEPVGGPVTELRADETTVMARITIPGRPRSGVITMRWMWRDLPGAQAQVNLAELNGGVLFSVGENTFLRTRLTTRQLYIGDGHRLVVLEGDREIGSYPFRVVPPEGARPSRFVSAALYRTFDDASGPSNPSTTFAPNETVFIVGQVALGHASWFDALVTVSGQADGTLTQEAIGPPDGGDVRNFSFRLRREAGWPPGTHRIDLVLNDQNVGHYDFTVAIPPPG